MLLINSVGKVLNFKATYRKINETTFMKITIRFSRQFVPDWPNFKKENTLKIKPPFYDKETSQTDIMGSSTQDYKIELSFKINMVYEH